MAEHEHGSMDCSEQQKMFDGFMSFTTKSTIVIIVALVLMAIFAT
ncbi:aa3-type cytochrome c oxidase subunit IV [Sulfitobacter sp. M57]|nr:MULTISPECIES: aa3-type cytochrome c oxidase subunit IV [unclassified Sulfitobacter]MDF3415552.1 aa3-type cytochrome c oxidase subunit IV [Sulfitobacter sp. KE5]MDF3423033.1 aa3-type cytochrome c oxidase subunit IV [Sulfitobacter sp. KE43]MDF3434098.1 aa3-type cytochrome c oxidase subunit IV [Sulfitobacter sp. KE42]MDF3459869.1 aa3-type cytochrome c oxidase subunit IV [Sulfitobacter sp. S74]MDF3463637.1 aa3-type cytochrome c oxidase subunit IV [Sulfitobacter sp. Ks18]